MRTGRTLLGAAAGIAVVTVVARAVGFGRTAVFTATVGLDCVGSTYTVANSVPNVLFEVVAGGALASAVVPLLAPALARGDRDEASRTASVLLTWTVLALLPVALAAYALAPLLVRLLLGADPTCGPASLAAGADLLRLFAPQIVLYGVAVVLAGVLQAHRRFLGPALAPLVSSLVVAASYLLYATRGQEQLVDLSRTSELVLGLGTTLGVVALAATLLVPLRGTGLRWRPALGLPPALARQARVLAGAGLAALAAQQLALVVALRLAATGPPGAPAVFTVATTVFLLPVAVLALPVTTSAFPRLSAAADDGEYAGVALRSLRTVLVLTSAGAAVLWVVAEPAARLLGAGPAAPQLAAAVRAFAPGLVGAGLVALLARVLSARGAGRAAGTGTAAAWLAVAVADAALVLGTDLSPAPALGVGNAVGMTLGAVLLLRTLARTAPAALAGTARTAGAGVLAAGAAALVGSAALSTAVRTAGDLVGTAVPASGVAADLAAATGCTLVVLLVFAGLLRLTDPAAVAALRRG